MGNKILKCITRKNEEITKKLEFIREQRSNIAHKMYGGKGFKRLFTLFEMVNEEYGRQERRREEYGYNDLMDELVRGIVEAGHSDPEKRVEYAISLATAALRIAEQNLPEYSAEGIGDEEEGFDA